MSYKRMIEGSDLCLFLKEEFKNKANVQHRRCNENVFSTKIAKDNRKGAKLNLFLYHQDLHFTIAIGFAKYKITYHINSWKGLTLKDSANLIAKNTRHQDEHDGISCGLYAAVYACILVDLLQDKTPSDEEEAKGFIIQGIGKLKLLTEPQKIAVRWLISEFLCYDLAPKKDPKKQPKYIDKKTVEATFRKNSSLFKFLSGLFKSATMQEIITDGSMNPGKNFQDGAGEEDIYGIDEVDSDDESDEKEKNTSDTKNNNQEEEDVDDDEDENFKVPDVQPQPTFFQQIALNIKRLGKQIGEFPESEEYLKFVSFFERRKPADGGERLDKWQHKYTEMHKTPGCNIQ